MKSHREKAKKIGVTITTSTKKEKKIDVKTPDGKIVSIGATGYKDYELYKKTEGIEIANQKRKAYRARHKCGTASKYSASNLACEILW